MKSYTVTITVNEDGKDEKAFEFYSDDENVLYKLDKEAYEEGKKLLAKALNYMDNVKADETITLKKSA